MNIKPMDWDEIVGYCNTNQIDSKKLQFNPENRLLKNACMSPMCPHYLKPVREIRSHMAGWKGALPWGFHTYINRHKSKSVEDILESYVAEMNYKVEDEKLFGYSVDEVKDYVNMIKETNK